MLTCFAFPVSTMCLQMCGNGVRCFARFIAELENLQGTQRCNFELQPMPLACLITFCLCYVF